MNQIDETGHRERFSRLGALAKGRIFEPADVYSAVTKAATHHILSAQPVDTRRLRVDAAQGTDNLVLIGTGSTFEGTIRFRGSNNVVFIGAGTRGTGSIDLFQDGSTAYLGAFSEIESGAKLQLLGGSALIDVGDNCLIGGLAVLSNCDGHPIYSTETGERQNENANIRLGNGVRVGQGCRINKGCSIGDGAAVMERSIVAGKVPARTLVDGVPGRVIAENIAWSRAFGTTLNDAIAADQEENADWYALRSSLEQYRHA